MLRWGDCVVVMQPEDENVLRMEDCAYVTHTACGPQDIKLSVSFKRREDASNSETLISIHETKAMESHISIRKHGETLSTGV